MQGMQWDFLSYADQYVLMIAGVYKPTPYQREKLEQAKEVLSAPDNKQRMLAVWNRDKKLILEVPRKHPFSICIEALMQGNMEILKWAAATVEPGRGCIPLFSYDLDCIQYCYDELDWYFNDRDPFYVHNAAIKADYELFVYLVEKDLAWERETILNDAWKGGSESIIDYVHKMLW